MGAEQPDLMGRKMDEVTFGPRPTYASDDGFELAVSPDGKACTITFSQLEAILDDDEPAVGRVFSLVLPVDSGGRGVDITLAAQGYAITTDGASGYSAMSINGQTSLKLFPSRTKNRKHSASEEGRKRPPSGTEFLKRFPSGTEESFTQVLRLQAGPTCECHLAVFVLVERSGHPDAVAYLNIDAIDAEISPRKEGKFELKKDSTGKYHFNLVAANGEIIATSESYEQKASAINGVELMKRHAADAELDDQTTS